MSEELDCPYGYEECSHDDYEMACDECRRDRAEFLNDLYMDTYD